jgi:hypothetical protein
MTELSKKTRVELDQHGIEVLGNGEVNITAKGMAWLMNAATGEAERELRIKAITLPVYDAQDYVSFCFYLNGSPPRKIYIHHNHTSGFTSEFKPDAQVYGRFGFPDEWDVTIRFDDDEKLRLLAGETLRIGP